MAKVTLESGREVEYTKPTWNQRVEIWDESIRKLGEDIPLTLETCTKILLYCKVCTEKELNDDTFSVLEVYEVGGLLLNDLWAVELTKKK